MKVPNCENALVSPDKLKDYLLNPDHSDGGSKAQFFMQLGFTQDTLSLMLLNHIIEHEFMEKTITKYGIKYAILGFAESPLGVKFRLKSIWIIPKDEDQPRLITAYPSKR